MFGNFIGGIIQIGEFLIGIAILVTKHLTCMRSNTDPQPSPSKWYHIFFPRFSGGGPYYPYENQFAKTDGISKVTWYTDLKDFGEKAKSTENGDTKKNLFEDLHLNDDEHTFLSKYSNHSTGTDF